MVEYREAARPGGLRVSLRAAVNAGFVVGFWHGLVDGSVAGWKTDTQGLGDWLGCLATAVALYCALWIVVLALVALALHSRLRDRELGARLGLLLSIGLGFGFAAELYWRSREWFYYGLPASDPKRLAVALGSLAGGLALGFAAARIGRFAPRAAKWALAVLIPIACLGGLAFDLAEEAKSAELGVLNERNRDLPNVVLFVVDALRADALACYGNARVKTPQIDRLASEGVLFERAMVQAPFTWSSFGSILTGKYPRRHGLVKMAPGTTLPKNVTLPWHLKSAKRVDGVQLAPQDYATAAFLTGTVSHGSGLARGFDAYFEAMAGHDLVEVENPWSVFRSELLISIFKNKLSQKLDDAPVAREACDWIERNAHKRFACKIHLYSTHTPYDPPAAYRANLCDPTYDGPIKSFYADARIAIEQGQYQLSSADIAQIQNLYYAGAQEADAMVGLVIDHLRAAGVLDQTLVIVTGDHGEELDDHGLWEHNWMFQTNLHVPLLMRWPAKLKPGTKVGALVQSVDILPTICDLAGLEPPGRDARDPLEVIDGSSLAPLARGETTSVHPFSFAENGLYVSVQDARYKLFVQHDALDDEGWKRALADPAARPQLFDLELDPGETKNLVLEDPAQAERLRGVLREWDASLPIRHDAVVLSARDLEDQKVLARQLKLLGYSEGVGAGTGTGHVKPPEHEKH